MFGFKVEGILGRGILPVDWKAFAKELKREFSEKGVEIKKFDQRYEVLLKTAQEEEKAAEEKYRERLRKIKINAAQTGSHTPKDVKTAEEMANDDLLDAKNNIKSQLRERLLGELLVAKN